MKIIFTDRLIYFKKTTSSYWLYAHAVADYWTEKYSMIRNSKGGMKIIQRKKLLAVEYDISRLRPFDAEAPRKMAASRKPPEILDFMPTWSERRSQDDQKGRRAYFRS